MLIASVLVLTLFLGSFVAVLPQSTNSVTQIPSSGSFSTGYTSKPSEMDTDTKRKLEDTIVNKEWSKLPILQTPPEELDPNYQKLPKNLRWAANCLTKWQSGFLKEETDPNIKICRFNAGNDNGITASCLNAFIHLNIDNECDNLFFKKLMEKLHSEQKPVNEISATTNPHNIIQNIFNELGDDVVLQNIADNERNALKNCLINGSNNPFEFMTALYKICGMERNEKFARSVTNKWLNTKTWSSPCMQLKPDQNEGYFSGIEYYQPSFYLDHYLKWDGFSKADFKKYADYTFTWNENISVNCPTKLITVSMDKLLPLTNYKLIGSIDDHIWDFVFIPKTSTYRLKSVICCNMTKDEILDGKVHDILKTNRKFSCILNNSQLGRFIVLDPSNPNSVLKQQRKNYPGTPEEDRRSSQRDDIADFVKIDDDNYRIPIMAFYENEN